MRPGYETTEEQVASNTTKGVKKARAQAKHRDGTQTRWSGCSRRDHDPVRGNVTESGRWLSEALLRREPPDDADGVESDVQPAHSTTGGSGGGGRGLRSPDVQPCGTASRLCRRVRMHESDLAGTRRHQQGGPV